jgi:uncharacterized protein with ATP-grasp and redox domains
MLKATHLCARCLVDQATHAVELVVDDSAERLAIMVEIIHLLQEAFPEKIPAELGTLIHQHIRERSGRDPYFALKEKSNRVAADAARTLKEDGLSLRKAVRAAVAGNAIDFGVDGSREALASLREELEKDLTTDQFDRFQREIRGAARILYLTDNCGEIAFDYLLVEQLVQSGKTVIVSPKEEPILNDATVHDLYALGFDRLAPIVPHSRASIGLSLSEAPQPFLDEWDRSDLVIAKGMGHFETLYGTDKKIAFLLKAKCIPVAQSLGVSVGSHVLTF